MLKKVALIPSYEPDNKIINLVNQLKKSSYEVVIVNDGSSKKYNKIYKEIEKNAYVISYKKNMGKGYALKKGISYINDNYKDYIIITMDCDGQHTVKDAEKLFEYNKDNLDTLVLGKRLIDKNVPKRSMIGNTITRIIYGIVTKRKIYDTQTGLRSFSYKLVDYMLSIDGDRYEYEMNVLLNLNSEIKVKEIVIETIYIDENKSSHFDTIKDSYLIYKQIIKFSLSSFISFIIDYILFIVFNFFTSITLSNIFARIISSIFNYNINKKIVFKSKNNLIGYYFLAIIILILNTLILDTFIYSFEINMYFSKILTEFLLFILSYLVQRNLIFKNNK